MRIAVVSDTHGHSPNTLAAVRMLSSLDVDEVIHCGDIGGVEIVPLFSDWPTHFVLGNVDQNAQQLEATVRQAGQHFHGRFGELEREGKRIAFLHSDDAQRFQMTLKSGEWDLVCYGHTHEAKRHLIGETTVLNPGALYRATPHSFAIVDLPSLDVISITVD